MAPPDRHCERSEAIHRPVQQVPADGLLRRCAPRNDDGGEGALRAFVAAALLAQGAF
jgi:hypothetical protein